MDMLKEIFNLCLVPLIGLAVAYGIKCLRATGKNLAAKAENETISKYINMLTDTITQCVIATNQTYVDSLKDKNAFDVENQKEAFSKTYDAVMATLSEDAKLYLSELYGDLSSYVEVAIEAKVKTLKK